MNNSNPASNIPWWAWLLGIAITAFGSYLATRVGSRGKVQANLMTQTVERQRQLDERQETMMNDFQYEIRRLGDELILVRQDLNHEKDRNALLENEMIALRAENVALRAENSDLKAQLGELRTALHNSTCMTDRVPAN